MELTVFASGSSGNALLLSKGESHIMIDAGISMRRIQQALLQNGLDWRDIGGVLITHEHSDHICGLSTLVKRTSVPVFAPHTVANRLMGKLPALCGRIETIPVGCAFSLAGMRVRAFHTPHDTDESVGYRIEAGEVFAVSTDMGCVTDEIREGLLGADAVLIEANHDLQMLRDGAYPFSLKRRILSDRGHLSNDDCALLARQLADNGTRRIVLGHLSRENNCPELAMHTVSAALAGTTAAIYCAPADGPWRMPF